jgi:hypothetical protein
MSGSFFVLFGSMGIMGCFKKIKGIGEIFIKKYSRKLGEQED